MIIDKSQLKDKYDIVIIGAGIAGLALSRFLNDKEKKILIIESGDFKFNKKINKDSFAVAKNLGNWPTNNYASYYSRVRMFGGNANVWGGWCMELDDYDYNHSNEWNLIENELRAHYKKAYEVLNINPQSIKKNELNMNSVDPYVINITRGNFINDSKHYLEKSTNTDLMIKTKLTKLNFDKNKIISLNLENLNGEHANVKLNSLIVSAGGIETAKILINHLPQNIKNQNIGKYFMEHPQLQVGRVYIKDQSINQFIKKYSPPTAKHLFDDKLDVKGAKYFSGFKSTNKEVRNYFVLRTSNVYQSKALYRLRHIILTRNISSVGKIQIKNLFELIFDVGDMFLKKISSFLGKKKSYSVVLHLEQKPNVKNQINIDKNNNISLDWNFTDEDFINLKNSILDLNTIFDEMSSDFKLNKIFLNDDLTIQDYLKKNIFGIGHHMGTTRMGLSKNDSVCDLHLKYHQLDNLYLNSTSVFPTGGIANPTLTLLALSSRLAEGINNE